jgi:hypothetical protein
MAVMKPFDVLFLVLLFLKASCASVDSNANVDVEVVASGKVQFDNPTVIPTPEATVAVKESSETLSNSEQDQNDDILFTEISELESMISLSQRKLLLLKKLRMKLLAEGCMCTAVQLPVLFNFS